jgi:hypothetical protein
VSKDKSKRRLIAADGRPEFTSAGVRWADVPKFARNDVAWIDGRHGSARTALPSIDVIPVPDILNRMPYLHENRPRGSKAMLDAHGARAQLRDARPGAWLVSPFSGWKWAKWPNGEVGWLPADVELPESLNVSALDDQSRKAETWEAK